MLAWGRAGRRDWCGCFPVARLRLLLPLRCAAVCSDRGTLVTYGNVSKAGQYLPLEPLLSKDITVRGFNLQRWVHGTVLAHLGCCFLRHHHPHAYSHTRTCTKK